MGSVEMLGRTSSINDRKFCSNQSIDTERCQGKRVLGARARKVLGVTNVAPGEFSILL